MFSAQLFSETVAMCVAREMLWHRLWIQARAACVLARYALEEKGERRWNVCAAKTRFFHRKRSEMFAIQWWRHGEGSLWKVGEGRWFGVFVDLAERERVLWDG